MDIKTVVVAGGPVASLLVLATHNHGDKPAQELPIRIGTIEAAAISTGVVSEGAGAQKRMTFFFQPYVVLELN